MRERCRYMRAPLAVRFWTKVRKAGDEDCWEWLANSGPKGYGLMFVGHNVLGLPLTARAHRIAWALTFGPVPAGLHVCHSCDNTSCVNPRHLFVGTNADNHEDRMRKGKIVRGTHNGRAKMTEEQVLSMRRRYSAGGVTVAALAREAGVRHCCAWNALMGVTWKEVPDACCSLR